MKIDSISLHNITSFKGKHEVNFKDLAKQSDLFAITGPTGAGKSTLLNAVAMAMFSKNVKGLNAQDLITTGEASGAITLCLSVFNDQYRIEWSCKVLKKDGTPRSTPLSQSIIYKNEELFEGSLQEVLNLDFNQFNQVIVLNQGKFSDFLTSSFSDRKTILENLLGHNELKDLSKTLRFKKSKLETQVQSLKDQSEQAQLLGPEELKKIAKNLALDQILFDREKTKAYHLTAFNRVLKELLELTKKEIKTDALIIKQQGKAKDIEKSLDHLTQKAKSNERVLDRKKEEFKKLKPFFEEARINAREMEKIIQKIKHSQDGIVEITTLIERNDVYLCDLAGQEAQLKLRITGLEKDLNSSSKPNISAYETSLLHLRELTEIETRKDLRNQNLQRFLKEKKLIESNAQDLNNKKISLVDRYEKLNSSRKEISSSFDQVLTTIGEHFALFKEKNKALIKHENDLSLALNEQKNSIEQLEEKKSLLSGISKQNERYKNSIEALQTEVTKEKEQAKTLEGALQQFQLLTSAKAIIQSTNRHEEDCPVCSSTFDQHEWIAKFEATIPKDVDKLSRDLEQIDDRVNSLTTEHQENLAALKVGTSQYETNIKEIEYSEISLIESQKNINNLKNALEKLGPYSSKALDSFSELVHEFSVHSEKINSERAKWLKNEELLKESEASIQTLIQRQELLLNEITKGGIISLKEDLTLRDILNAISQIETLIENIKKLEKSKEQLALLTQNIEKVQLDQVNAKKSLRDKNNLLTDISQELTALQNTKAKNQFPENPSQESLVYEEKIEEMQRESDRTKKLKNEQQNEFDKNLSQINLLKEQNNDIQSLKVDYLNQFQTELESLKTATTHSQERIPEEYERFFSHIPSSLSLSHLKENIQIWDELFDGSLAILIRSNEEMLSDLTKNISRFTAQIEQNDKQNKKIEVLLAARAQIVESLDSLLELEHYVGKDQFRDFTLAVLEENLLSMANAEIASLADGRYKLLHAKAGRKSEFLVQDFWQGGLKRKVSTLSGGETFLLSLGLSLGLCEISRGQTEIDCFFIDEGFGTLDSECIEQVLDCLMALQSRGKQIGLISHVKSLTDQIPVRLELSKNNFGESSLSIN